MKFLNKHTSSYVGAVKSFVCWVIFQFSKSSLPFQIISELMTCEVELLTGSLLQKQQ
jgi:hypothetical protein